MPGLLGYCETKEEEDWHLEQERQAYEAARDAEEWEQMRKRIAELERDLENLKAVFRVNMIRAYPTMTHEEVTTAIEVALRHERLG